MGYVVYNIVNPITGKIIYVGATANIERRIKSHTSKSHNRGLFNELKELADKHGRGPVFNILQSCDKNNVATTESYWINHYISEGYSLHNQSMNKNKVTTAAEPNQLLTTNISLRSKVLIASKKVAKEFQIRGGLSGYIEKVLITDLKKKGVKLDV